LNEYIEIIRIDFITENKENTIDTTFGKVISKLGLIKIYQLQYFRLFLELFIAIGQFLPVKTIQLVDNLFVKTEYLYEHIIKFLFNYEWNNLYHNEFLLLFKWLIQIHRYAKSLFNNSSLISKMSSSIDKQLIFSSGSKINSGCTITIFEICDIIITNKITMIELIDKTKWMELTNKVINHITVRYRNGNYFRNKSNFSNEVTPPKGKTKQSSHMKFIAIATIILIFLLLVRLKNLLIWN